MGTLTTTIKLNDQFSKALGAINTKINKTIQLAERMNRTTGSTKYADLLKLEVRLKEKEIALTKLQNENELKVANATEKTAQANKKVEELKKQIDLDLSKTLRAEEKKNAEIQRAIRSENELKRVEERRKLLAEQIEGKIRLQNNALEIQKQKYQGIFGQLQQWASKLRNILTMYYAIRGAVQGVGAAIKLSDKMTMTDAKFNLVAGGDSKLAGDLKEKTFYAAQRSTTDYLEFGKAVGKLGILAGDKFANTDSIVKFVELMNKSFQISGAETSERNAAMLQITQAIASNRLQGDEFRSILENAPMVMDALTKSLGVGHDKLKAMAKEGEITADVLIKAMFDAGSKIESMYAQLDMTWERHLAKLRNVGVLAFEPIHEQIKKLFNSKTFQKFIDDLCTAMIVLGNLGGQALKSLSNLLIDIHSKFNQIKTKIEEANGAWGALKTTIEVLTTAFLLYKGVQIAVLALTKSQAIWTTILEFVSAVSGKTIKLLAAAWDTALVAFTLANKGVKLLSASVAFLEVLCGSLATVIIAVVCLALAILLVWFFKTSDGWIDAVSRMVGGAYWLVAALINVVGMIINGFVMLAQTIWQTILWLLNWIGVACQNIGILFSNAWFGAREAFWTFIQDCLNGIKTLAPAINAIAEVFGKKGFDINTTVANKIQSARSGVKSFKTLPAFSSYVNDSNVNTEFLDLLDLDAAYARGYGKSEKFLNSFSGKLEDLTKVELNGQKLTANALNGLGDKLGSDLGDIAKNTGDTAKNTSKTNDYSYLRDWYYQKGLGNSIGYNIKIEQNNRNNVASSLDLDKIADALIDKFMEGLNIGREGARI